jgi:energy-coupling factor transporter ATP-binding protein EcfA2
VDYRYPDHSPALSGIDLDIAPGDRIALVGQNGSGKTTLIKHLCGLLGPARGEVLYRSLPLEGEHLEKSRLEIGLLFQDPDDQLFGHTLLEDAAFGPRHQGICRRDAEFAARQALVHVGLESMAYKAPHNLSFGQKKRAALAGLLAMNPRVLLLDEPTANLDPSQEQVFLNLLSRFQGTLVCISHDLIFLYELCHRAVVLDRGRLQHDYTMKDLVSQRRELKSHGLDFSFRLVVADEGEAGAGEPAAPESGPPGSSTPGAGVRSPQAGRDAAGKPPLVDLREFRFRYPDGTRALAGVDLAIARGEKISIVGENGAGKTTLLSCLLGLCRGTGTFLLEGRPVTRKLTGDLWRKVGMVFQDCADQLFCPSVEEEVAFGLVRLGLSPGAVRTKVTETLDRVRLNGFEQRVPLHLSGGERKRLALACVLAMEPALLILDEPTAGLDPQGEELLLEILGGLDATLVLVSHDMFFVGRLTRRTLVMHQGKILEDLPVEVFLQDSRLGALNGLAYTYRQRSSSAIRKLQHEHEHSHRHLHRHVHPHRHGDLEHVHAHDHAHEHPHRFVHSHPDPGEGTHTPPGGTTITTTTTARNMGSMTTGTAPGVEGYRRVRPGPSGTSGNTRTATGNIRSAPGKSFPITCPSGSRSRPRRRLRPHG